MRGTALRRSGGCRRSAGSSIGGSTSSSCSGCWRRLWPTSPNDVAGQRPTLRLDLVARQRLVDLDQVAGRVAQVGDADHPFGLVLRRTYDDRALLFQGGERVVDALDEEGEHDPL